MNPQEIWKAALAEIQLNISKANYLTWFKNTFIKEIKDKVVKIAVPSSFVKEWLETKYHKMIYNSLKNLIPELKKVSYEVVNTVEFRKQLQAASKRTRQQKNIIQEEQLGLLTVDPTTNLNPKYTFENFIVGSFNELAHAAALAVTRKPGAKYNPLFIYGGVGLGKTHLLQAIGNQLKKSKKKLRIKYVTSEKFTEELVSAIREQKMSAFKRKFRSLDVLLIDDIQFVAGKDKVQEELFHTFNTLSENNKQIVFTSDRPPKAISSIEERLRSRFEGGMVADIGYPDFETRLAILKEKNKKTQHLIPEDSLEYLAKEITKNIRELEGALNRLIINARLKNKALSLEDTKKIISSIIKKPKEYISPQQVIKKVAAFYDLSEKDLLGHSRKKELVKPRQIIMYLLREELGYAYTNIAEKIGQRDHTTVIHAYKKIANEIERNPVFAQEILLIKDLLYNK